MALRVCFVLLLSAISPAASACSRRTNPFQDVRDAFGAVIGDLLDISHHASRHADLASDWASATAEARRYRIAISRKLARDVRRMATAKRVHAAEIDALESRLEAFAATLTCKRDVRRVYGSSGRLTPAK